MEISNLLTYSNPPPLTYLILPNVPTLPPPPTSTPAYKDPLVYSGPKSKRYSENL